MAQSFNRTEMLPALPPPISQRGAVKWMNENLLSSPLNIFLTVVGFAAIVLIIVSAFPWWANSVWNAGSLKECRDIVTASAGEGASGACWAYLRVWWGAVIFGHQYPVDERWRPILTFGLLFVALAPVLFAGQKRSLLIILGAVAAYSLLTLSLAAAPAVPFVLALLGIAALLVLSQVQPAKLLWFTLAFPPLCFWLLWGGSIWTPIVAMAGFAVLYFVFRAASPVIGLAPAAGAGLVAAVLWWLFAQGPIVENLDAILRVELLFVPSDEFGGFLLSTVIGITGITFSLPIGILLALGRQSDMPIVKMLCVIFIEAIRGVPLITLLFVAAFVLGFFLPPNSNFDLLLRVLILVTVFSAAYLAEVLRGSLAALPRGQYEAADALGLDYWRAQRLIILPQALKISIPAIVSSFIGLFKDTTLVTIVALYEPLKGITGLVRADVNWKGIYWEPYIFVGTIFFVFCFGMSRYSKYLEGKLKTDHR
ncbi:Amino acid ABC transporter, permease protein, 3-TM domain [Paracoccaceae bacterium]|jgi:general L-amino acid transport system permease protein